MDQLLSIGPVTVNIGVEDFADTLEAQGFQVLHVDWSPPAGGDSEMISLLEKLL
jgi:FdrA protein